MSEDNWTLLLKKYGDLIDSTYRDERGTRYTFFGLVNGSDDYYFGMCDSNTGEVRLLSCVGDLTSHGFAIDKNIAKFRAVTYFPMDEK